jgi:hypothetical protein
VLRHHLELIASEQPVSLMPDVGAAALTRALPPLHLSLQVLVASLAEDVWTWLLLANSLSNKVFLVSGC